MAVAGTSPITFSLANFVRLPLPSSSPTLRSCTFVRPKGDQEETWIGVKGTAMSVNARFGSSKGGAGLLERPSLDQTQFDPATQVQEGGDSYRVLLIDDIRHTEKLVAKVLPQVVPSVTPDDARRLFNESREKGVAIVIVTVKEHAEFYVQMMIRGGLRSTMEPDATTT
ncbi:ATP-dependent Clp protease adapter protein ClpS [Quillaja saponaria]|uniref:ATP-dependent Clp protease adapter protein ClpS n=1 Tax=Quillaja saponaria TaxID=32244 RepID=A0AAD7LBR1_QUISA|nr:ATP-dependent Clp protease adapter protein ClpS [Quillaja saponaria]